MNIMTPSSSHLFLHSLERASLGHDHLGVGVEEHAGGIWKTKQVVVLL